MKSIVIALIIFIIILLGVAGYFIYLYLSGHSFGSNNLSGTSSEYNSPNYEMINIPTSAGNKTILIESNITNYSISDIEKSLANYSSIILKLYSLHNIPLTSITPKIQSYLDNNSYFMEVSNGDIIISEGNITNPDITIATTSQELSNILENGTSVGSALSSGSIKIDAEANQFTLASKGYLTLFNELYS